MDFGKAPPPLTCGLTGLTFSLTMIWDEAGFRDAYRARLGTVQSSGDAEVRAQLMAFRAEVAKAGGETNGEHFTLRAGNAAAVVLSGYVRGALDAFDQALATLEAELEEADLNALRTSLDQEIARRAKALPATLRDFYRTANAPARLRAIVEQAPVKARQLLAERVSAARSRIHTREREREVLDRAIFIGFDVRDATLADALKLAITSAFGNDVAVCTSSDLESLRTGRNGLENVLTQLKRNRMTLALLTPSSIADASIWWTLGMAEALGKPAFVLKTSGMSVDAALPLRADQVIDLTQRDDVVRLLQVIQSELRRRTHELSELDLDAVIREAAGLEPARAGR